MKKLLTFLLILATVTALASCESLENVFGGDNDYSGGIIDGALDGMYPSDDNTEDNNTEDDNNDDFGDDNGSDEAKFTYTAFTSSEKKIFTNYIGAVIPFAPNNEYYVEGYYEEDDYEHGVNYYTVGNSASDFAAYRALYSDYTLDETYTDDYGDTWYCYIKDDVVVDMSYYLYDGEYYIDVFVYSSLSTDIEDDDNTGDSGSGDNTGDGGSGDNTGDGGSGDTAYQNTAFTSDERALFLQYIGVVIPFVPNNEYYIEGYYYEDDYEHGMNFYTYGNTQADFNAYRALYSAYTLDETYTDEYGDTWYCYIKNDVVVDMSFYYYDGDYVIDVYVYSSLSTDIEDGGDDSGGNWGDDDNNGGSSSDIEIITNNGKGLPTDADGVHELDFTDANIVKDVTDQGYYLDGCPTTGSPKVLVIPIQFTDVTAASKGYSLATLKNAFVGTKGTTDYYSVYEYYYISSYGQLTLDITVLDEWFTPAKASTYYASQTDSYGQPAGDQMIMDEALAYLESRMDLSEFDSDGNGFIDAIVLINTLEIGEEDFYWAYRYWNMYGDDTGSYYEYDGVCANDYLWASYQFLYESNDDSGENTYDSSRVNTYTFIHEFAHVLGTDDYYDTSYSGNHPLNGLDVMDDMRGDHNAYSKFNLGWITTSRLVVANGSITLTLEDFSKNGDTIIIANNWDDTLGAYQEYYVLVYYTNNGLNSGDGNGYFERNGVIVYHVNASLYKELYEGEIYYDVYNTNTDPSDQYGTEDNLIEFVLSDDYAYTYVAGDSLPAGVTDDSGNALAYTFTVDSLTDTTATITFTKR